MYNISRDTVEFQIKNNYPREIYFKSPFSSGNSKVDRARALLFGPDNREAIVFFMDLGAKINLNDLNTILIILLKLIIRF